MSRFWGVCLGAMLCTFWVIPGQESPQKKINVRKQAENSIRMDDGFEYELVDYGVGRVQVKYTSNGKVGFSDLVFWVKFRITNKSEHLIKGPSYPPSHRVVDNWGNEYWPSDPFLTSEGLFEPWRAAMPLVPLRKRPDVDQYKPGEWSWVVQLIRPEKFVKDVKELRIYLRAGTRGKVSRFFLMQYPLLRHRDLLGDQADPSPTDLQVSTGIELPQPTARRRR